MSIHVSNDAQNVDFGNVLDKGRKLVKEGGDVRFITGIDGTVTRDVQGLTLNVANIIFG